MPDFLPKMEALLERYSQEELGEILGVTGRSIQNYLKGDTAPHPKTIRKIHETYEKEFSKSLTYTEKRRESKLSHVEEFMVPYVNTPAEAGYLKSFNDTDFIQSLTKFYVLPGVDPRGAVWRYFSVSGDSMEPEFCEGDVVLCSQVFRDDWPLIRDFYTYVVVTESNIWIKDVFKESESEIILLSQNETYEPILLNISEIRELWVMRRHVKNRAPKSRMYDMKEVRKKLKKKMIANN